MTALAPEPVAFHKVADSMERYVAYRLNVPLIYACLD